MVQLRDSEFLASPGGKLDFLAIGTSEPIGKKRLMRGGDRLVQECSWMSGIRFTSHRSTYCCRIFELSPPLISHNENIGSEAPLFCCDSFPPGEAKRCKPLACILYYSWRVRNPGQRAFQSARSGCQLPQRAPRALRAADGTHPLR